ncbi:MAG: hypothetical protein J6Z23_02370 [Lachnospiraceae bacterium]|nr:hypothetical protein [Lachnospiraceae bacterium]
MRVTGISGSVRDGIPAESTYVKPDTFDEIEPFILDYFSAWESGGPVPAAEEVIRRWEAVYSDLSPGSLGDHTYLGGDIDEEGKHSYRFSFRYHRTILDEPDLCILEVVAFGYKHLLEIIRRDDGWTVVKDVGTHGLHSGYTGEAREEAFEIYRRVAVRLTEGLGEEDIEAAREGVKNAFPKIDVFWGIPHTGTEEELRAVMPAVLVEEEYDHEVNIDRIAQWLSYDHPVPLHVPFVILHANVEEAFTLNGYAYSPEKISGYPPVIVKRTEEGWVLAGIVYSY